MKKPGDISLQIIMKYNANWKKTVEEKQFEKITN